jgi:hypothetical protein
MDAFSDIQTIINIEKIPFNLLLNSWLVAVTLGA